MGRLGSPAERGTGAPGTGLPGTRSDGWRAGRSVPHARPWLTRRRVRESKINAAPIPSNASAAATIPLMSAPVKARPDSFAGCFVALVGDAVDATVPPSFGVDEFDGVDVLPPVEPPDVDVPLEGGVVVGVVPVGGELDGSVVVVVVGGVVVVVVVVVGVVGAGAPSWQPDTVSTEWSVPVRAEAEFKVAPSGVKTTKCTAPLPFPIWAPAVDVSPAGEKDVVTV